MKNKVERNVPWTLDQLQHKKKNKKKEYLVKPNNDLGESFLFYKMSNELCPLNLVKLAAA